MGGGSQAPTPRFSLGCWRLTGLRTRPRDANGDTLQANGEVQCNQRSIYSGEGALFGGRFLGGGGEQWTNGVPPKIVQTPEHVQVRQSIVRLGEKKTDRHVK